MKNSEYNPRFDDTDQSELSDLLPDFLNGHLADSDRTKIEAALETNTKLREQLEFQRELQTALRAESLKRDEKAAVGLSARVIRC